MPDLKSVLLFAGFLALLVAGSAQAQPSGPGGPGNPAAAASSPGRGYGPGPGYGPASGPVGGRGMMHGRWGSHYTPGWGMMTPQERSEHRERMSQARTPEECRAARDEHRKLMEERAKARGAGPMRGPRRDACGGWGRG